MPDFLTASYRLTSSQLKSAIALAITALLTSCLAPANTATQDSDQVSTAEVSATASLVGQTVTVRNDIEELLGETAFTLDEDQLFGGEAVLVINASKTPLSLIDGEEPEVQVSGTVEQFSLADIERKYALKLDSKLHKYQGKPVIVAQSVVLSPDPGDLTQNPQAYYGKAIAVQGEVEDIRSAVVFELDEEKLFGAEDLLVIVIKPDTEVQDEENVVVTGVLRPFIVAEFEREYELNWDLSLQEQIEAEYSNKPVLVAEDVFSLDR